MSELVIKPIVLGMVRTNCYLIHNEESKETIIVDPADDSARILEYLKENDLVCKAILLTHGHFDHIMAAKDLKNSTDVLIYAHESEAELLKDPDKNSSSYTGNRLSLSADYYFKDQEELTLAGLRLIAIHTPGHTAGGACYLFPEYKVLISGDTLFRDSIGRSDLPTGNGSMLVQSIKDKLMILEDQIKVYPGHGNSTTIGYERSNNVFLNEDLY